MKRDKRIPTLLGIILLIVGVAGGVVLIKSTHQWKAKATKGIVPLQVRITNIGENSFAVSWITEEETTGFIQYEEKNGVVLTAADDRDQLSGNQGKFWTHHVTVQNLKPNTEYFFKINSGGRVFDNNGQPYRIKTAASLKEPMPPNDVAYGTILKQDNSPAEGVIVYLSLPNAVTLSSLTKASGSWVIPLNLARSSDLSSWVVYDREASTEEIFVQGGPVGTATAVAITKNDSPLPDIILGQTFDFRNIQPTITPTQETPTSRFSFEEPLSSEITLVIINPQEGEEVNTTRPEVLGKGPAGETLTIIVNSPKSFTSQVTINQRGEWSWTPPEDLSPGRHTITVTLPDGRKVTRSFVVLAAGTSDLPSFSASPSATITLTPTPFFTFTPTPTMISTSTPTPTVTSMPTFTPSPTFSAEGRISLPSTEGGIPKPGYLTPTLLLLIMGVAILFLGIVAKKGGNFF